MSGSAGQKRARVEVKLEGTHAPSLERMLRALMTVLKLPEEEKNRLLAEHREKRAERAENSSKNGG